MNTDSINKIFEIFSSENPHPKTELEYKNHFTMLLAVVLSAQSTDIGVNKATKELFTNFDTAEKILALGEDGLKHYIKTINLYKTKAKHIIKLCSILTNKYDGNVPGSFEELIELPGVGRKTANVVLNSLFNKATIAIDTHVYRVAKRIGLSSSNTLLGVENDLLKKIPKKWLHFAHHWLILHGRYICKARKPLCEKCKLQKFCKYYIDVRLDEISGS
jgi:endonuclease III